MNGRRRLRGPCAVVLGIVAVTLGLAIGGCGRDAGSTPGLAVREVAGVGRVITDGGNRVLYMFAPDERERVTCHGVCAASWPPLRAGSGAAAVTAGDGVRPDLVGSVPDSEGGPVVTYAGWPLYTYLPDRPGQATGQAIDVNGGYWYVMRPDGRPVVPAGSPPVPGA